MGPQFCIKIALNFLVQFIIQKIFLPKYFSISYLSTEHGTTQLNIQDFFLTQLKLQLNFSLSWD